MCTHPGGEPTDIVVDDREHAPDIVDCLRSIASVSVRIARLKLGDYLANQRLLFERKTLQDFARSIIDARLFKQMMRLANSNYKAVVILEGTGKDLDSLGVRREAMQGALISIALIFGIPILRSMHPDETAKLIVYAARQFASFSRDAYRRSGYRPKNKKRRQLHILQGLPGVGQERALRLLATFGSVEAVMRASLEELQTIEGIGAKTANLIKWAIHEKTAPYGDETWLPI